MRYEFCEGSKGKDSGGSLEGGVVRKHDPVVYGVGVPIDGEERSDDDRDMCP